MTLDTYIMTDQPETCPKCGTRTEFVESLHGNQLHWCMDPSCDYEYLLVPDEGEPTVKKAYIDLIDYALAAGHVLRVDDGGDEDEIIECGTDRQLAIESIEAVEEAHLLIYTPEGKYVGWALIIPYNGNPEETLADYGVNPFMEAWADQYYEV